MKKCPTCKAVYHGSPRFCPMDRTELVDVHSARLQSEIGGWVLRQTLSEGRLSSVYQAERRGEIGALKLYQATAPLHRVAREAEAQQRIAHPNIATLLDQGESELGEVYLVTEFVPGASLRQVLEQIEEGMPWELAALLAAQMASGLEAIHAQGLLHRDLKPENIMIVDAPPRWDAQSVQSVSTPPRLKILDLGHALMVDQVRLTQSGLVWGSASYMSPEQAAGHTLDARSDLYSLGVVLYEMLVGRRPFEARAVVDVMQMHWTHQPQSPARARNVPGRVSDLCLWLLAKNPHERPGSARVVQAALGGIVKLAMQREAGQVAAAAPGS